MDTPLNSSSASSIQAQNSHWSFQVRRFSAAHGIQSPSNRSCPLSITYRNNDQEQFVASSPAATSDSLPSKDAGITVAASTSFAEYGSIPLAGADAQLEKSENGGGVKKPAWKKPSNEAVAEVGPVMGAESWPALSESARAYPKSSSTCSLKALPQASVTLSQEMAIGPLSLLNEVTSGISTPNSKGNHFIPSHQRSMKRGGASLSHSSIRANDSSSQAPPRQGAVFDAPPPNLGKTGGLVGESSYRDAGQRGGSYGGNEVHMQRSSFRRNNSGPLFRGDGSHHHSFGGKRDQERRKQDWSNLYRGFGRRESHASHGRTGSMPFFHGPHQSAPFTSPPPSTGGVRPFVTSMVYTEMPSPVFYVPGPHPDSLRPMPMVSISSMFFPMPDPYLHSKIVNQIDYYFSNENLVKDTFLRQNMDGGGWVSIKLIAGFKKVMQLTDNIQLILHAIQASNIVELQGDKVRRKNDWIKWIMPPMESNMRSPRSFNEPQIMLAAHFNSVTLGGRAAA
ncbi:hypothetical protein OROMI_001168 [Orobanche minor]